MEGWFGGYRCSENDHEKQEERITEKNSRIREWKQTDRELINRKKRKGQYMRWERVEKQGQERR